MVPQDEPLFVERQSGGRARQAEGGRGEEAAVAVLDTNRVQDGVVEGDDDDAPATGGQLLHGGQDGEPVQEAAFMELLLAEDVLQQNDLAAVPAHVSTPLFKPGSA